MRVEDYYQQGKRWFVRFHEKGGKHHTLEAHHKLEEYLDRLSGRHRPGTGEEQTLVAVRQLRAASLCFISATRLERQFGAFRGEMGIYLTQVLGNSPYMLWSSVDQHL